MERRTEKEEEGNMYTCTTQNNKVMFTFKGCGTFHMCTYIHTLHCSLTSHNTLQKKGMAH